MIYTRTCFPPRDVVDCAAVEHVIRVPCYIALPHGVVLLERPKRNRAKYVLRNATPRVSHTVLTTCGLSTVLGSVRRAWSFGTAAQHNATTELSVHSLTLNDQPRNGQRTVRNAPEIKRQDPFIAASSRGSSSNVSKPAPPIAPLRSAATCATWNNSRLSKCDPKLVSSTILKMAGFQKRTFQGRRRTNQRCLVNNWSTRCVHQKRSGFHER